MGPSVSFLVWAQTLTGTILCKKLVNPSARYCNGRDSRRRKFRSAAPQGCIKGFDTRSNLILESGT